MLTPSIHDFQSWMDTTKNLHYSLLSAIKQIMISFIMQERLNTLGRRLKEARLERDEPQKEFAARLGISIPTLFKMEHGDASVSIGLWVQALWLLDRLDELDQLLANKKSLFDLYESQTRKKRQRATKRNKHD